MARTVVDCFRSLRLGDALAVGDAALRRNLTSLVEIEDALDGQFRWPHVTRALRGIPLLDPRRENWLESYSAAALFQHGLFSLDGAFIGRVDALWEELGIVGEADGAGKYLGDFDPHQDRSSEAVARRMIAAGARESRLREVGFGVVRWDPKEIVTRPAEVAGRVQAAARRHRAGEVRAYVRYAETPTPTLYAPA